MGHQPATAWSPPSRVDPWPSLRRSPSRHCSRSGRPLATRKCYAWLADPPTPGDFRVTWVAGRPSRDHPHVITAEWEGRWSPEDGYECVVNPPIPGDLRVTW